MDGATRDPRQRGDADPGVELLSGGAPPTGVAARLTADEYQRSRFVADLIERLRGANGPLALLDVGGRGELLQPFLPEDRVISVDLEAPAGARAVHGDGRRLPFRDGSFDAVVACDTLQHVPYDERERFLRECRRVARRWVLVVGPYRSPRVEQAEDCLRTFLTEMLGEATPELEAHARHGLPTQSFVEARLRELGGRVASVGHGNLERWLATSCLSRYLSRDRELRPVARELHRFYSEFLYARDLGEPAYRHAVVAAFEGAPLIEPEALARDLAARDPGAEVGLHLARELVEFDLSRDVVQAEWERLRAQNHELEAEITRQGEALELERAEREETRRAFRGELDEETRRRAAFERQLESDAVAARRALEEELAAARREAESLAQNVEALTEELERQRARGARSRTAYADNVSSMELDLASYRQLVADMSQQVAHTEEQLTKTRQALEAAEVELDSLRRGGARVGILERELNEAVRVAETLQMEIGGRDHEMLRKQAQLEAAMVQVDQLSHQLEGERATSEELRGQLGRRFGNLKRVFARRPGEDEYGG